MLFVELQPAVCWPVFPTRIHRSDGDLEYFFRTRTLNLISQGERLPDPGSSQGGAGMTGERHKKDCSTAVAAACSAAGLGREYDARQVLEMPVAG